MGPGKGNRFDFFKEEARQQKDWEPLHVRATCNMQGTGHMLEKSRLFTRRQRRALHKWPMQAYQLPRPRPSELPAFPALYLIPILESVFFLNQPPPFLLLARSSCSFWNTKNLEISAGVLQTPIHTYYKVMWYLKEPLLPKDPLNIDKGWVQEEPLGVGASIWGCCADPDLQECCLLAGLRAGEGRWRRSRGTEHRDI